MESNKKISISSIIAVVAAVGFFICLCVKGVAVSEIYREYSFSAIGLDRTLKIFFETFMDVIIMAALLIGIVFYKKNANAAPIAMIAYSVYILLIRIGKIVILQTAVPNTYFGLFATICSLVISIVWAIKPESFKMLSLLYIPYMAHVMFSVLTTDSFDWKYSLLCISEILMFAVIIIKNIQNDGIDKQLSNKTIVFWLPTTIIIGIECVAYLFLVTA